MQLGSVVYNNFAAAALGPGAANNGLSVSGGIIQLGGPLGSAGAAVLLNNREIPSNNFNLFFSGQGILSVGNNTLDGTGSQFQVVNSISITNGYTVYFGSTFVSGPFLQFYFGNVLGSGSIASINNNFSTFFGFHAGGSIPTTIQSSSAFGYNALASLTITTSANNDAFGTNSQKNNLSGLQNASFGINTLEQLTTGSLNVCVGSTNGFGITTQNQNTLVGALCCNSPGTAHNNAGAVPTNSTFLGYNAGGGAVVFTGFTTTYTNCICIGSGNGVLAEGNTLSNTTILGNGYTTNVNNVCVIGVGTATQNTLIGPPNNQADLNSVLQVFGSLSMPISSIATSTSIGGGNFTVICTATLTLTLQAASTNKGRIYCIIAQGAAVVTTNVTFINLAGVGVTTIAAGTSVMLQSDGTNWQQIK